MKKIGKDSVSKRVVLYEVVAFLIIIAIIWLDEVLDIPNLLWGAPRTPINWSESVFESAAIAVLAIVVIHITLKLFHRMKTLEGLLPICASCKKIKDGQGSWKQIETYVRDRSEAEFTHGICPDCARKLYPDYDLFKK